MGVAPELPARSVARARRAYVGMVVAILASVVTWVAPAPAHSSTAALLAWGSNDHGQLGPNGPTPFSASPVQIPGLGNVTQVSAGYNHTLALRADGTVMAWGRNAENELGDGHSVYTTNNGWTTDPNRDPERVPAPSPDNPVPVEVHQRTEALKTPDGTIQGTSIWRITHDVQSPPYPLLDRVNAVAAGWYHNLALKSDGTVWAWGENFCGQLGNGKSFPLAGADMSPPAAVQVPDLSDVVAIATGRAHSLALDKNGVVWAWGENRWGQLGNGQSRTNLSATCWMPDGGQGYVAQTTPTPVALPGPAVAIAAGSDHSLALTGDGTVLTWGNNCAGQLGSGPDAGVSAWRAAPAPVLGLPANQVTGLAAGGSVAGGHSLALSSDGQVWGWGLADVLGSGDTTPGADSPCSVDPRWINGNDVNAAKAQKVRLEPARVVDSTTGAPLTGVTELDGGLYHTLALGGDGRVWAWGRNDSGQVGSATPVPQTAPSAVIALAGPVSALSAGSQSVVAPVTDSTTTTTTTLASSTTTTSPPGPAEWEGTAPMNVARRHLATAVDHDGRIYAFGGTSAGFGWAGDGGDALKSAEVLDPCGTGTWRRIADMPAPRVQFAAATGPDGRIYVIGGRSSVNGTALASVDAYDPGDDTWAPAGTIAPLARPRGNLLAATGPDGRIYAIGGQAGGTPVNQVVEAYDIQMNQWSLVAPTSGGHVDQGATMADGRVYALGGGGGANESYAPGSGAVPGTWRTEPSPQYDWPGDAQLEGAVTTGPDGLIYDIGGKFQSGAATFGGVSTYNPNTQTWRTLGDVMTIPRQQLGAAAGRDGRIYAIGGVNYHSVYPLPDPDPAEVSVESYPVAPSTCPVAPPPTTVPTTTSTTIPPAGPRILREDSVRHTYTTTGSNGPTGDRTPLAHDLAWQQAHPATSPPAREGAAMAYDAAHKQTVLFGGFVRGAAGDSVLHDTWLWDGVNWTEVHPPTSPPARYGHAMTNGPSGVVLFGGYDGINDLGDTWTWDGDRRTWVEHRDLATSPSPRARTAMAYDESRGYVVLFGGDHFDSHRVAEVLGDTWAWDGSRWLVQAPFGDSPPARAYASMAYHAPTKEIILYGGWGGITRGDTWTWNGISWLPQPSTNGPGLTHSGAMAYHPATGLTAYQAGNIFFDKLGAPPSGDTDGVWTGTAWSALGRTSIGAFPVTPPPRTFPAVAEDALGHVVFFGGFGTRSGDTSSSTYRPPACVNPDSLLPEAPDVECTPPVGDPPVYADQAETWVLGTPQTAKGPEPATGESLTVKVEPYEVAADGTSTVTVTATAMKFGVPQRDYGVTFTTNGDVSFEQDSGVTDDSGTFSTTIVASTTPGFEQITATFDRPIYWQAFNTLPPPATTMLSEKGIEVSFEPVSLPADGHSSTLASATVYKTGDLPDEQVCFSSNGDVEFSAPGPGHCGARTGPRTWTVTITASRTPGPQTITAHAERLDVSGSAILDIGGGRWMDRSLEAPGPSPGREEAAMAYDPNTKLTVLFGGSAPKLRPNCNCLEGSRPLGDTWIWDSVRWRKVPRSGPQPSPRIGPALAYDASSEKLLLFGGHDGTNYLGDTWVFDSASERWTQVVPHNSPPPRYVANMASDGEGVVLFAGTAGFARTQDGPTEPDGPGRLHDTWTWRCAPQGSPNCPDGTWTEQHPEGTPPPPVVSPESVFVNNTPIAVPLPPPPPGCPGVHCDPDKANPYPSPISVSGLDGTVYSVTVTVKDLSWTKYGPADADIMLESPDGRTVMLMSDACGTDASPNPISRNEPITLHFDAAATAEMGTDHRCLSGAYKPHDYETPEATPFHRPDYFPDPAPHGANSPALQTFSGVDPNGTWKLWVVDDNPNDPDPTSEAGRIDGGWALGITTSTDAPGFVPGAVPPGRGRGAMAYDPDTRKVLLFGGTQEFQTATREGTPTTFGIPFEPMGDTWSWDPVALTWTEEGAGDHPGARRSAVMAWDARTHDLVLHGGSPGRSGKVADPNGCLDSSAYPCDSTHTELNDTWLWDGHSWSKQTAPYSPPEGHVAAMAPDRSGHVVLLAGVGKRGSTYTWEPKVDLQLDRQTVAADGTSTATGIVTVMDETGQGLAGLPVQMSSDGDVTFSAVTDRGDGTYAVTVTASRRGGIETLRATTPWGTASATLDEVGAVCAPGAATSAPGSWSSTAPMPHARYALSAATGNDGRMYTFGGFGDQSFFWDPVATVESYNPCDNSWLELPPMPLGPRAGTSAAVAPDGRIYVVGGLFWDDVSPFVEVYTPGSGAVPGRWQMLPPMTTTRYIPGTAVTADGNLYVTGGWVSAAIPCCPATDSVEIYSGTERSWQPPKWMPTVRALLGSAVTPDGRVLAIGGVTGDTGPGPDQAPNATVDALQDGSDSWQPVAPMANARFAFGAATGPDGVVYAIGGSRTYSGDTQDPTNIKGASEAYAPCAGAWAPITPLPDARSYQGTATGPDGRIYTFGGLNADNIRPGQPAPRDKATKSVQAYTVDPATSVCPSASIDDVTVQEPAGLGSTAAARFTVSLNHPSNVPVAIAYQTSDGSAAAPLDYLPAAGVVQMQPGETSKIVEVTILADSVSEPSETFSVKLSAPPESVPDPTSDAPTTTSTTLPPLPVTLPPTDPGGDPPPDRPPVPVPTVRIAKALGTGTILDQPLAPPRETPTTTTLPAPTTTLPTPTTLPAPTTTVPATTTTLPAPTTTLPPPTVPPAPTASTAEPSPLAPHAVAIPAALAVEAPATVRPPDRSEPGGSLPGPEGPASVPTFTQSVAEGQAEAQGQSQAHAQSQTQSQSQNQRQLQAQAQQQTQAQTQAQAQLQVGMMAERQREIQVEGAHAGAGENAPQTHLASARRRPPPPVPVLAWAAALAMGVLCARGRGGSVITARQRSGVDGRRARSPARSRGTSL